MLNSVHPNAMASVKFDFLSPSEVPDKVSPMTADDYRYQEALRRIQAVATTGDTYLNLSGLGLTSLPPEIASLTGVTKILLQDNSIGEEGARIIAESEGLRGLGADDYLFFD